MAELRLFHSFLGNRIYGTRAWKEDPKRGGVRVTGEKTDVTDEAIGRVLQHMEQCREVGCRCEQIAGFLRFFEQSNPDLPEYRKGMYEDAEAPNA